MITEPVLVGLGRETHLAMSKEHGRTYCGREWTATVDADVDITCQPCREAYAAGRHPHPPMTHSADTAEGLPFAAGTVDPDLWNS